MLDLFNMHLPRTQLSFGKRVRLLGRTAKPETITYLSAGGRASYSNSDTVIDLVMLIPKPQSLLRCQRCRLPSLDHVRSSSAGKIQEVGIEKRGRPQPTVISGECMIDSEHTSHALQVEMMVWGPQHASRVCTVPGTTASNSRDCQSLCGMCACIYRG